MRHLIISADDYGYSDAYDDGILEAADAGAVDAVSVLVGRGPVRAMELLLSGVELGLHLELGESGGTPVAGRSERESVRASVERQLDAFESNLGRPPAFLDGHHHCHATPGLAGMVGELAAKRGLVVRSVDDGHRRLLRRLGALTPDLLVGRLRESEAALPAELQELITGGPAPEQPVVEWMVHPGRQDLGSGSTYDGGREQDLGLLLELLDAGALRRLRATHAAALAT